MLKLSSNYGNFQDVVQHSWKYDIMLPFHMHTQTHTNQSLTGGPWMERPLGPWGPGGPEGPGGPISPTGPWGPFEHNTMEFSISKLIWTDIFNQHGTRNDIFNSMTTEKEWGSCDGIKNSRTVTKWTWMWEGFVSTADHLVRSLLSCWKCI